MIQGNWDEVQSKEVNRTQSTPGKCKLFMGFQHLTSWSLSVLPLLDGHETPCRSEMQLALITVLPSPLGLIVTINTGLNTNSSKPESAASATRSACSCRNLAGWWWEGSGDGKGGISPGDNGSTALPCFNDRQIFFWNNKVLWLVSFWTYSWAFNPQVALMARKAAPSGLSLNPAVSL